MRTTIALAIALPILACLSARAQTASAPAKAPGVIRIRAGVSEPFKDSAGNTWEAERGFEGGSVVDHGSDYDIANTKEPGLYRSEHYSMDSFSIDVPNGKYIAKLHFAETYNGITAEGQRVFNFNVQGKEFKDFDTFKKAGGPNKAYVETVPVEVTDGKFKITFTPNVENPQINAIEITPQTDAAPAATAAAAAPAAASGKGVIRIRAGSSEPFKDSAGNTWEAERGFEGGSVIDRDPDLAIANTKDPGLYRSEHYSMDSFSCDVPKGKYIVKLHFAETFDGISGEGQRVFSFNVQGKEFKDFDVYKKAGGSNKAYIETVPVDVTDGKLKITFTSNIENPEINAIEIAPQSGAAPAAPAAASGKGVIRIRAGSSEPFKDSAGNTWEAERGFEGGSVIDRDPDLAIANTKDPGLYRSEHYSMDSFSCDVPKGKYLVKLHFAETFDGISGEGQRVFSFNVQGKEFKDFDVYKKAGGSNKAYIETVPVDVTDGKLKITFTSNIENPEINAIEIVPQN